MSGKGDDKVIVEIPYGEGWHDSFIAPDKTKQIEDLYEKEHYFTRELWSGYVHTIIRFFGK